MSDEENRVLIGRVGERIFIEHTRSGARIELTPRMARSVVEALIELADEIGGGG